MIKLYESKFKTNKELECLVFQKRKKKNHTYYNREKQINTKIINQENS